MFVYIVIFIPFLLTILIVCGLLLYGNPETSDKMLHKTKALISTITNTILKPFSKKHRRHLRTLNTIKALIGSRASYRFQYIDENLVLKFGHTFITIAEMLLLAEKSFYEMSSEARSLNRHTFDETMFNLSLAMKEEYSRMEDTQAEVDKLEAEANMRVLLKANELASALLIKK